MTVLRPTTIAAALEARAEHPGALVLAGGTDAMVAINAGRLRADVTIDVTGIAELAGWARDNGTVRIGAALPYTRLIAELGDVLPGLAMASRTVGSPQIRNRGSVGGNVATASPAGDALPPLVAADAVVELASLDGVRRLPIGGFLVGPKRSALLPTELITAIEVPVARGPQQFSKVGPRNAMVIAVCSLAVDVDVAARRVAVGIGSAGPTTLRAPEAEAAAAAAIEWESGTIAGDDLAAFAALVAEAARPIDDVRGTAAYRRHALAVLARRSLSWSLDALRREVA